MPSLTPEEREKIVSEIDKETKTNVNNYFNHLDKVTGKDTETYNAILEQVVHEPDIRTPQQAQEEIDRRYKKTQEEKKYSLVPVSIEELLQKPVNPFPYIVDRMIPKKAITTITGDTGSGKSLFILYLADHMARGEKLFGEYDTKKANVLLMDFEMDEDLLVERSKSLCTSVSGLFLIYERIWKVEDEKYVFWLHRTIDTLGIGVVIFDTLSKVHNRDENSNTEMTVIMEKIRELCTQKGVTVILLHHHNKNSEAEGLYKSRGASSIQDNSASYLQISSKTMVDKNGKNMLNMEITQEKKRRPEALGKIGINIYHDKETGKTNFEYLGIIDDTEEAIETIRPVIFQILEEMPGSSKTKIYEEVKNRVLAGRKMTDRVIENMVQRKQIVCVGEGGPGVGRRKKYYLIKDNPENLSQIGIFGNV